MIDRCLKKHEFSDTTPVEIAGRVQVLESGDLLIADIKPTDAGKYTCIRANEAGSVNGSAYVSVLGERLFYLSDFLAIRSTRAFKYYIRTGELTRKIGAPSLFFSENANYPTADRPVGTSRPHRRAEVRGV